MSFLARHSWVSSPTPRLIVLMFVIVNFCLTETQMAAGRATFAAALSATTGFVKGARPTQADGEVGFFSLKQRPIDSP